MGMRSLGMSRSAVLIAAALANGALGCSAGAGPADEQLPEGVGLEQQALDDGQLPNNFPFLNGSGTAATFSTAGFIDFNNPFHVPAGHERPFV